MASSVIKGKVHPITGNEGPEGSRGTARGKRHAPAALLPGMTRYPLYRRLGGSPGLVWTDAENLVPTGIRSPDRPPRSELLYRLRYPGPASSIICVYILNSNSIYT
jgi:hypothetical protein